MAKRADPAKTRLLAKARRIAKDVLKYSSAGYVTTFDDYRKDDEKLHRAVDSLYDLARKHGLLEDPDIQHYRLTLRRELSQARERASQARSVYLDVLANGASSSIWGPKRQPSAEEKAFDDERRLGEAQRSARRR